VIGMIFNIKLLKINLKRNLKILKAKVDLPTLVYFWRKNRLQMIENHHRCTRISDESKIS